ncbi:phosphoethanolamine transferase [Aliamphritea spongicola]|uniref:phosphoethanolamine transferase n=1 Tax=Aliamphritea spongicola TaxID=707589 RepID=UPI00196B8063|nr:phosphoethanolamine transferase [Aliamphritea spongicola]MBN3562399.1 phosphoethanolamine transferase [Aliamphritea spongicola]
MQNIFSRLSDVAMAAPKRAFCAIVLLVLAFDLVLVRDFGWVLENFQGKRFLVNYGLSSLALVLLTILLLPLRTYVGRTVVIALILIPQLVQLSFFAIYRNFVSVFDLRFVAEDPLLTLILWLDNAAIFKPLLLIALELPLLLLLTRLPLRPRWWARGISGVFGSLLFLLLAFNWYGVTKFQFSSLAYIGTFPGLIEQQVFAAKLVEKPVLEKQVAAKDAPNIVFVVGESLTKSQMGVYGYDRDTTPNLQRLLDVGELVLYDNAVSIGTKTLSSVPYMLTGLQGIDPHGRVYSVPTIFNYAKAAGYQTALITAQDFKWRNVDQMFLDGDLDYFQEGTDFSSNISVSIGADDMTVLEKGVMPYLKQAKQSDAPYMLVVQMNGNHYPYSKHSPDEFKKFLPEEDENGVNAYDNSVAYSDHYFNELINAIRADDPDAWIFFSTDHGQNIDSKNSPYNYGYGLGTTHNAMFAVPPASEAAAMQVNTDRPVSSADIFATILGLMDTRPVSDIDGENLREPIDPERLRVISAYMKTLHNDPNAVLVFPDLSYLHIDFERKSAILPEDGKVVPYTKLPDNYRRLFDRYLNPQQEGANDG